jgi:hypothetical protein
MRTGAGVAAAFLLVLLAVGSLALWIAVPAACLWLASKVANSIGTHFLVALPLTLASMALFAALLYRLDRLYLRVTGAWLPQWDEDDLDDDDDLEVPRGPLEPMIIVSFAIAAVALTIWFFFFAENPSSQFL